MTSRVTQDIKSSIEYIHKAFPEIQPKVFADFFSIDINHVRRITKMYQDKPIPKDKQSKQLKQLQNFLLSYRYNHLQDGMIC